MKKLMLLAVVAFLACSASAQNWYIGGSVGYNHTEVNGIDGDRFTIIPEVGYNFSEKFAVGGTIGYAWEKDNYNTFTIEPYARYTFFRTDNELLSLFVDGGFGVGIISPEVGDSEAIWNIGIKPGLAINITKQFSLVAHIGFLGYKDYKAAGKEYGFNLDGNDISFGFYYNF